MSRYRACECCRKIVILLAMIVVLVLLPASGWSQTNNILPFQEKIKNIETRVSGRIGVSILRVDDASFWNYRGDERFPLMSTFKTLACAKMLFDIDAGRLLKNHQVTVKKQELITWSPVTEKMIGQNITIHEACEATMLTSDNTAANLILGTTGGPTGLTSFLRQIGDDQTRLDRVEPELGGALSGDVRDTTTPKAIVNTLYSLIFGNILSPNSKNKLRQWMMDNTVSGPLLRSILPQNWTIADRSGAGGNGSRGITAIIWPDKGGPLIVSIYITETKLSLVERDKIITEIGQLIFDFQQS